MKTMTPIVRLAACLIWMIFPMLVEAQRDSQAGYSFESVAWSLRDDFGYQAGLLKGADGGLVGVSLRMWNNSAISPLTLRTTGSDAAPLVVGMTVNDGATLKARAYLPKTITTTYVPKSITTKEAAFVSWTLAPRAVEYLFIPARDFLPSDFAVPARQKGKLVVYVTVRANDSPPSQAHELWPNADITMTAASLNLDALAVFQEWRKNLGQARQTTSAREH